MAIRSKPAAPGSSSTIDADEVARFSALAGTWWDADGPMRPLHRLNPTRLEYVRDRIVDHFGTGTSGASRAKNPPRRLTGRDILAGLTILDIGCGAGLVTEPLTRLGAQVTGIDPARENIEAARRHAAAGGLTIDYRATTAEALAADGESFDVVLILEVVEHVADVDLFIQSTARLVKPGGMVVASTINRTLKAFALAIVGAEYVLRWLPRGTHSYDKLVTPSELAAALRSAGLSPGHETGVMYVPLADRWRLSSDMDVNYMMTATRPE